MGVVLGQRCPVHLIAHQWTPASFWCDLYCHGTWDIVCCSDVGAHSAVLVARACNLAYSCTAQEKALEAEASRGRACAYCACCRGDGI